MSLRGFNIELSAGIFGRQAFFILRPFGWKYQPFSRGTRGQTYLGFGPIYVWSRVYDSGAFVFEISVSN